MNIPQESINAINASKPTRKSTISGFRIPIVNPNDSIMVEFSGYSKNNVFLGLSNEAVEDKSKVHLDAQQFARFAFSRIPAFFMNVFFDEWRRLNNANCTNEDWYKDFFQV